METLWKDIKSDVGDTIVYPAFNTRKHDPSAKNTWTVFGNVWFSKSAYTFRNLSDYSSIVN